MNPVNLKTPGVYIDEVDAIPHSVVPAATAVPAFIGYTPQAEYEGKSYHNVAQKITSLNEFLTIYCLKAPAQQYHPVYYLLDPKAEPGLGDHVKIDKQYYPLVPDPNTIYYFYNSIRLFFENGGNEAYIVSVGGYGQPSGKPIVPGQHIVNPNVKLAELLDGLKLLENTLGPTMYVCPDATLLSVEDNGALMQAMLSQCAALQNVVSIFDVIGARYPDPIAFSQDIEAFRNNTGINGLSYGIAYYPFVGTSTMVTSEINYTNLFGGDLEKLAAVLGSEASGVLAHLKGSGVEASQINASLDKLDTFGKIQQAVLAAANTLPPSGAMAGVITTVDVQSGVWQAPANKSIMGVKSLTINLTDGQQSDLNVDATTGKSVNAIRNFKDIGILVWGARTLDGNSLDWRYISVRRTAIFIEQSCKQACQSYAFQQNDQNTWKQVTTAISSFLTNLWKQGGLQGSKAADAFSVSCGLGSTMTADDITNGYLRVQMRLAMSHPAEFIEISLVQQMAAT